MITLYTFGPYFGLPDGSPFVTKVMLLLKMAGLSYREDRSGYIKAPKGKLPYLDDDGIKIADSVFIRWHIEKKYGFDFDAGLSPEQKAIGWALERMCEDHLYWTLIDARWMIDSNFVKGPAHFFDGIPKPLNRAVARLIQRRMRKSLVLQGLGRHSRAEIEALGKRDIQTMAALIGDKPFVFGDEPKGADATMGAFTLGLFPALFETELRTEAGHHPNLGAYAERIGSRFFAGG